MKLVIDGTNLAFRAWKSIPMLTTSQGQRVEVVYGTLRMVKSLVEDFQPNSVLMTWDIGRSEDRMRIYPGYKSGRRERHKGEKDDFAVFISQLGILQKALSLIGVASAMERGVEADDIIAEASHSTADKVIIISNDLDFVQLVNSRVFLFHPIRERLYTPELIKKELEQTPAQYFLSRLLIGDTSDSIPGIQGVGKITAKAVIGHYKTLSKILEAKPDDTVPKRVQTAVKKIHIGRYDILRNIHLMRLGCEAKIVEKAKHALSEVEWVSPDLGAFKSLCEKYQFASVIVSFNAWREAFSGMTNPVGDLRL